MPATVDIVTPNLVVNPGEAVSTQLRLTNTGRVVDEITVEILGDAGPFASVDPAALPLFPGAHGVVTVTFRPPRGTSPVAGIMPVGFRVRSREDPAFSYVAEARLEIGAVLDVGARLSPRNSVAGRMGQGARHRVELENAGNSVARVTIAAGDPDDRLSFRIATPVVLVPPGGRTNVTISVGTRDRMWTGAPVTRPFQVVANPDGAQPITLDGSLQQRPAIFVGTSQILTVAVVVGVAGLLASQLLPALVASPSSTPSPSAATATGPSGGLATAGSSLSAQGSEAPAPTPPPSGPAGSTTEPAGSTAAPSTVTIAPATASPTPTQAPSSAPPMAIRIINLGLTDPLGQPMLETPPPEATPEITPGPGSSFRPPHQFSFPIVIASPQADGGPDRTEGSGSSAALALQRRFAARLPPQQDQATGPPVQQLAVQVAGNLGARITRVSDATAPTLCLRDVRSEPACASDASTLNGKARGPDPQSWFLSVVAQQGGTSVDVEIQYPAQAVTLGFKDLHLAGVSAGSGVHVVIQASQAGLIEIVTQVNVAADVTVTIRDLNTGIAPPPSTSPAGIAGAPYLAAAEAGHFYDILLTSSSPEEVFVSGTIAFP